jgi:hypothetical protein
MSRTYRARLIRVLCIAIIGSLAGVFMSTQNAFAICNPKPPDFAGCSAAQMRPHNVDVARREFTGYQHGWRHYQWGERNEGAMWHGIKPSTNHILSVKYADFVHQYRKHNHGHYPYYRTWQGLKDHSIGGCIKLRKRPPPDKNCHYSAPGTYQITGIMSNGQEDPNFHFLSKCNGALIAGAAGGATAGAIATAAGGEETGGLLIGVGALGAGAGGEVSCQVLSLYNWLFPSNNKVAASAGMNWGYN